MVSKYNISHFWGRYVLIYYASAVTFTARVLLETDTRNLSRELPQWFSSEKKKHEANKQSEHKSTRKRAVAESDLLS